jgi:hypothetical protein
MRALENGRPTKDEFRVAAAAMLDQFDDMHEGSLTNPMGRRTSGTDELWEKELKMASVRLGAEKAGLPARVDASGRSSAGSAAVVGRRVGSSGSDHDGYEPERAVTRFTALRVEEYREWVTGASDVEIAQLTSGLRKLRDAWMEADARCINLEVELNIARESNQELTAALHAAEAEREALVEELANARAADTLQAEVGARAEADASAQEVAELRKQASAMRAELDALNQRDVAREVALASSRAAQDFAELRAAEAEAALAATSVEVETLTSQVRALILKSKGASESALLKRK